MGFMRSCFIILTFGFLCTNSILSQNTMRVQDDTPPNQLVGTVDYSDKSSLLSHINQRMDLEFRLQRASKLPAALFTIDADNGNIYTKRTVDREELCQPDSEFIAINSRYSSDCQLKLQVIVSVKNTETRQIPEFLDILIYVEDRNDHIPKFSPTSIQLTISEAAPSGTKLRLPQAVDLDSDQFNIQNYLLKDKSDGDNIWTLEVKRSQRENSEVYVISEVYLELRGTLDRETKKSYELEVIAYDGMQRDRSTDVLNVSISVEDENDNLPKFLPPHSDYLEKSQINERLSTFDLKVNENEFLVNPLIRLKAEDSDLDLLEKIHFVMSDDNDDEIKELFNLSKNGDLYVNRKLDYEQRQNYLIKVYISDNEETGTMTQSSSNSFIGAEQKTMQRVQGQINITVVDRNDEVPKIEIEYFNSNHTMKYAEVRENSKANNFLGTIIVEDADLDPMYSNLMCKLMPNYNSFSNNKVDGDFGIEIVEQTKKQGFIQYNILTRQIFDREERESLQYRIFCQDSIKDFHEVSEVIILKILDENDNAPTMEVKGNEKLRVYENSPKGSIVGKIMTKDMDKGVNGEVKLEIVPDYNSQLINGIDLFEIQQNGDIRTKIEIDRESSTTPLKTIPLTIRAQDHGEPKQETTMRVEIEVLDRNDNAPQFHINPLEFTVTENEPAGICLGEISVYDLDENLNLIELKIKTFGLPFKIWSLESETSVEGEAGRRFYLNTTQSLDREKVDKYEFEIVAIDGGPPDGKSSTCQVVVKVDDINDNDPIIIFPQTNNKTFVLSNKELVNYELLTINSKDEDSFNGPHVYEIYYYGSIVSKNASVDNFLQIDPTSGIIRLGRNMELKDTGSYLYRVNVKDMGVPTRNSSIDMIVRVADIPPRSTHQINFFSSHNYKSNSETDEGLFRFGSEGILMLALGLVLLLLLTTLGLILFARSWHVNHQRSFINGNSKSDRCLRCLFCCMSRGTISMPNSNIRSDYTKTFSTLQKYPAQYSLQNRNSPTSVYGMMDPTYQISRNRVPGVEKNLENFDQKSPDDLSYDSNPNTYKYFTSSTQMPISQLKQNHQNKDLYATLSHDGSKLILRPIQVTNDGPGTPNLLKKTPMGSSDTTSTSNSSFRPMNNYYQGLQNPNVSNNNIMILDGNTMEIKTNSSEEANKNLVFKSTEESNPWHSYV